MEQRLFFYRDRIGIKYSTKVEKPLIKETNSKYERIWRKVLDLREILPSLNSLG